MYVTGNNAFHLDWKHRQLHVQLSLFHPISITLLYPHPREWQPSNHDPHNIALLIGTPSLPCLSYSDRACLSSKMHVLNFLSLPMQVPPFSSTSDARNTSKSSHADSPSISSYKRLYNTVGCREQLSTTIIQDKFITPRLTVPWQLDISQTGALLGITLFSATWHSYATFPHTSLISKRSRRSIKTRECHRWDHCQ